MDTDLTLFIVCMYFLGIMLIIYKFDLNRTYRLKHRLYTSLGEYLGQLTDIVIASYGIDEVHDDTEPQLDVTSIDLPWNMSCNDPILNRPNNFHALFVKKDGFKLIYFIAKSHAMDKWFIYNEKKGCTLQGTITQNMALLPFDFLPAVDNVKVFVVV